MNSFEKIRNITAQFFKVPMDEITAQTNADHIDSWDSFTHMELMTQIESAFNLNLPLRVMMDSKDLGDIAKYIDQQ